MVTLKTITIFVVIICLLVLLASSVGILSLLHKQEFDFKTVYGDTVKLYGSGIYHYHTTKQVYQAVPHDMVNAFLAIPALIISFMIARKGVLKARLFFMGVTLYILFTYTIYTFFAMYNRLYIVYVAIMGLAFYTLILSLKQTDKIKVKALFKDNYPNKLVGGFMVTAASLMTLFWLKTILPTLLFNEFPTENLGQSTTLVPYAIDLAFVLPLAFTMGIKLYRKKAEGYIFGTVLPAFLVFMMAAVFSKGLMLTITNTENAVPAMVMMGSFSIVALVITRINYIFMRKET